MYYQEECRELVSPTIEVFLLNYFIETILLKLTYTFLTMTKKNVQHLKTIYTNEEQRKLITVCEFLKVKSPCWTNHVLFTDLLFYIGLLCANKYR